jgi:hypothetical protein
MKASNIQRHLKKLGVTMEKIIPPKDGQRWSTILHSSAPETIQFSNALHAFRYWDALSRAQIPLLTALEEKIASGMTDEDIATLDEWAQGNQACPDFIDCALSNPPSNPRARSPDEVAELCAIYGPISSPWVASFVKLARVHASSKNGVDSSQKWIWGKSRGREEGH